jgi:integrase
MASVSITRRRVKKGTRYVVRYRVGGRAYPIQHGGSFKTEREAKARRDLIAGELAHGRNPKDDMAVLLNPPRLRTFLSACDAFNTHRKDKVGDKTYKLDVNARNRAGKLGALDITKMVWRDFQSWVDENGDRCEDGKPLSRNSLGKYLNTYQQVLDYHDFIGDKNPARHPNIKLPIFEEEEPNPPSLAEWEAVKANLSKRVLLVCRFMECTGARVGTDGLKLTYKDMDFANNRVRISKARTKGGTAGPRWLPVPAELMDELDALVPLEDRHADRLVWPNVSDSNVRYYMSCACRDAGIAHYHPHDLRDRRISLWIAQGIDRPPA